MSQRTNSRAHINILDSSRIPKSMEKMLDITNHQKAWEAEIEYTASHYSEIIGHEAGLLFW